MARARRFGAQLAAVAVVAVVTSPVAWAGPPVPVQGWTRTGAVPTFVADAGRLYVAADVGVEQARAFIGFDAAALSDPGGVLTVHEAAGGRLPEGASLAGCPLTTPITVGGELTADAAPGADCSAPIAATRATDGSWTIPLDSLAAVTVDRPVFGVAVVPVLAPAATFHVVLDPAGTSVPTMPSPVAPSAASPAPHQPMPADGPLHDALLPALGAGTAVVPDGSSSFAAPATAEPEVFAAPVPLARRSPRSAASPPAVVVLPLVAVLVLAGLLAIGRRGGAAPLLPGGSVERRAGRVAASGAILALPLLLGEANVYKVGLVLVLFVGAIGMHLLVNWAGELSLAHATLVGLPAFVVAKTSADTGVSPILLVPLGLAVGALTGAVIGLPAIRARGLQVALVTLAGGVAIDRFFFTRESVVGPPAGAVVPVPTLGPLTFATARSLYPVLAVFVVLAVGAAWMLYRSKLVRGMLWIKADPAAASAFGIPVARYRTLAYVLAGTFAGFSGALTATWVQRLTPQAFPVSNSFTYLVVVAVAGRGFVGGVAAAAAMIEGGRLFLADGGAFMTYAGPVGLILTLTRYRGGLNGLGARLATTIRRKEPSMSKDGQRSPVARPAVVGGAVAIALGFASIALAWYHAGNTSSQFVQNQELISGGIGGLGLLIVGTGLVIYDRLSLERAATAERWERLLSALERGAPDGVSPDSPPQLTAVASIEAPRSRLAAAPR